MMLEKTLEGPTNDYIIIPWQRCKCFYTTIALFMVIFFVCWKFLSIKVL